jgi:hypothetical protein
MPHFLVTMNISDAGPGAALRSVKGLAGVSRESIVSSHKALLALRAQHKGVIGAYLSDLRSLVIIMDTESEEQVYEVLENLPVWGWMTTEVARLRVLEELSGE